MIKGLDRGFDQSRVLHDLLPLVNMAILFGWLQSLFKIIFIVLVRTSNTELSLLVVRPGTAESRTISLIFLAV